MTKTMTKALLTATLLGIALLGVTPATALAQDASQPPLPAWEQLTQAQRDELVAPMRERWNANPDERARMLERARRWHAMPPELRDRAHRGMKRWEHMDPAKRAEMQALFERTRNMPVQQKRETFALYHAMRDMTPEQREALKQQWTAMTADERAQWMRDNAPPRWRKRGH